MTKKILIFAIAMIMLFTIITSSVSAATITLKIDGVTHTPTIDPVDTNGTAMIPVRYVFETLGGEVSFNQAKQEITVQTAAHTLVFTIGSKTYTANGTSRTLPQPVALINSSTMVPLESLTAIGATVSYSSSTVNINYFTKMTGNLKVNGSTTLQPIAQAAADKLMEMNKGLSISVAGGGSGTGINDAKAGTVNIGMSSRELTADEMKTLNVYAVANDGIAIIVHPDNPVTNLTTEQARKIFLGEIKNWKDVGGNNAPILVMTRETGSGTRATLEEMILDRKSIVETATPFTSSNLIKQAVAKEKNAIGFDSIGFVDATVKAVSLDSKDATAETVMNSTYGMGRQLFTCTKGKATGLSAMFIDYLRSTDCQNNIVEKEGYVKLK